MYPIERCFGVWHHPTVPPSHDDRIRELCAKAAATTDPAQVEIVLAELRAELHSHIEQLRTQTGRAIPLLFHPQNEAAD
jgi:hypothetical protein